MKILRVFPRKTTYTPTDELAFIGDPQFILPEIDDIDEVHVSCTFTWDIPEARRLKGAWSSYYPAEIVKLGGPAFGNIEGEFIPGRYVKEGVTFTTRGCDRSCPFCLVPEREGRLIEIENFSPGWIIQDNNFLQASHAHIERVFEMLRNQFTNEKGKRRPRAVSFAGGLQASLVDDWFIGLLRTVRIDTIFLAADTPGSLVPLARALKKLSWLDRRQLRVYTLLAYDGQTLNEANSMLRAIWRLGGLPFAQLYQPKEKFIKYPSAWTKLAGVWSRPANTIRLMSEEPTYVE